MTSNDLKFDTIIPKFDAILARGLCAGIGTRDGQMCVEAAICAALDLPHGDQPWCVAAAVRQFKIGLNDAKWSSPQARAQGLRNLGIAQIGSQGIVDGQQFSSRLAEKTIRILIPDVFRFVFPTMPVCLIAAARCEQEGTYEAARAAGVAATGARAACLRASAAPASSRTPTMSPRR